VLTFTYVPTRGDYLKSFRTIYLRSWPVWSVVGILMLVQGVCIVSALLRGEAGFELGILLPLAIFVFLAFYLTFALVIRPLTVANKVEKDERLSSPVHYEVSDEQIVFRNQFAETRLDWGSFQKVVESQGHFLLLYTVNKNAFQIIPKRAFGSPEDEQAFRDLLKAKIPDHQESRFNLKNPLVILGIVLITGFCLFQCVIAVFTFLLPALLTN
jgi:hypothetical protein